MILQILLQLILLFNDMDKENINNQLDVEANKQSKIFQTIRSPFKISLEQQIQPRDSQILQLKLTDPINHTQHNQYQSAAIQSLEIFDRAALHVPFKLTSQFFQRVLSKLTIIVTNHHHYYMNTNGQSAFLNLSLNIQQKSKILHSYENKTLTTLYVTPEIFHKQTYHRFECQILIINELHLYHENTQLLKNIVKNCCPKKIVGCFQNHLPNKIAKDFNFYILPHKIQPNQILWIKTDNKQKTLFSILNKNLNSKILILVSGKSEANFLSNKLSLQSHQTNLNLCELVSFKPSLSKQNSSISTILNKANKYDIVLSQYFQGLKTIAFDVCLHYNFKPATHQTIQQFIGTTNYCLLSQQDYFSLNKSLVANTIDIFRLDKIVEQLFNQGKVVKQKKAVRFYSETLDQIMLKRFSVSKQSYVLDSITNIQLNKFCRQHCITKSQFQSLVELLIDMRMVTLLHNTNYIARLIESDHAKFQSIFKHYTINNGIFNVLDLANTNKMTSKQVLRLLKVHKIRYIITDQIVSFKLQRKYEPSFTQQIYNRYEDSLLKKLQLIDYSYFIAQKHSYNKYQYAIKERTQTNKNQYFEQLTYIIQQKFSSIKEVATPAKTLSTSEKQHLRNQVKDIYLNLKSKKTYVLSPHSLIQYLQGIQNDSNTSIDQMQLFNCYSQCRYSQLLQLVRDTTSLKKIKLQ